MTTTRNRIYAIGGNRYENNECSVARSALTDTRRGQLAPLVCTQTSRRHLLAAVDKLVAVVTAVDDVTSPQHVLIGGATV